MHVYQWHYMLQYLISDGSSDEETLFERTEDCPQKFKLKRETDRTTNVTMKSEVVGTDTLGGTTKKKVDQTLVCGDLTWVNAKCLEVGAHTCKPEIKQAAVMQRQVREGAIYSHLTNCISLQVLCKR